MGFTAGQAFIVSIVALVAAAAWAYRVPEVRSWGALASAIPAFLFCMANYFYKLGKSSISEAEKNHRFQRRMDSFTRFEESTDGAVEWIREYGGVSSHPKFDEDGVPCPEPAYTAITSYESSLYYLANDKLVKEHVDAAIAECEKLKDRDVLTNEDKTALIQHAEAIEKIVKKFVHG